MDPMTDLPPMPMPMTTLPADHAAGPPLPLSASHPPHPPYAEMITAAITALKDRDGSSRQAISKYIEKEYANLPPTHSTMLTHHLKRLKSLGQLVMVKHSYMLPSRSAQFQPPSSTGYHPTLDFGANLNVNVNVPDPNATAGGVDLGNSPTGLSKRKPGRPPKLKPEPAPGVRSLLPNVQTYEANVPSYQPQFQYNVGVNQQDLHLNYGSSSVFQGNSTGGSGSATEPLFASLGLGDDGVAATALVPAPAPAPAPALAPPSENTSVVKRGRGRPPKAVRSGGGGSGSGGGEVAGMESGSERPVRKPKMMSVLMGANGGRVKRGRGRPRRIGIGPVTVPLSGNLMRPRGRPKRATRAIVAVNGGVSESGLGIKRSGRPRVNKIPKFTGRPVGRPSKVGPGTAVLVTDPRQLVVYQELKSKYELLQSKVKHMASVVKPCLDSEYGSAALGALRELEALAGGDTNGSSSDVHAQTQEPEPVPQN